MNTLQQPLRLTAHQLTTLNDEQFGEVTLSLHIALDNIEHSEADNKHILTINGKALYEREQHAPAISAALWLATQPNVANASKLTMELNKLL